MTRLICLICLILISATTASADLTLEERHTQFEACFDFASLVKGGSVTPNWLDDGARFWYAAGDTFFEVDTATGESRAVNDPRVPKEEPEQNSIREPSPSLEIPSPDGTLVAVIREFNLYIEAADGISSTCITHDGIEDHAWVTYGAQWSPDGAQVAFLRMSHLTATNEFMVGIADVQTGTEKILAKVGNRLCYGIRWSPDGRRLAMIENSLSGNLVAAGQLDLVDIETGEIRQLPSTDLTGSFTAADWAPDSKSFLVGKTQELLSHITGRPGLIMEYFIESETHEPLFWSNFRTPQGGWGFGTIAVLNDRQVVVDGFKRNAILQEFPWPDEGGSDGSGTPRILTTSIGFDRQPVYSPDGKQVLFSSNRSGNIDLWIVDLESGALKQITDDPAHDWDPAFSPDNQHILWSSSRTGHMEIWMANRDGSGARQVS